MRVKPRGTGPGPITGDGCAVDLYAMMLPHGEAELIHAAVPAGAPVLELGCGTGRITRGLLALGHPVTGVDFSAEMLAHMPPEAKSVLHDIETLRLEERFGVVTLTSNMVTGEREQALAFLRTARHHLDEDGVVIIERLHPRWAVPGAMEKAAAPQSREHLTMSLHDIEHDGDCVAMTIRYTHDDGRIWTHHAAMHGWSDADLTEMLRVSGLQPVRWLDAEQDWLLAAAL